jgi:DNA-binding MarR family transcriptional regulator
MSNGRSLLPARPRGTSRSRALESLVFGISRAFYAYVARLETVLSELGLDEHVQPGMGHVLFALFEEDDVIIKSLVARTRLAPSSLGRLLLRMEKGGLIERRRCAADARAVRIRLTTLGRSLEPRCQNALRQITEIVEQGLEVDELQITGKAVERIVDNLRNGAHRKDARSIHLAALEQRSHVGRRGRSVTK